MFIFILSVALLHYFPLFVTGICLPKFPANPGLWWAGQSMRALVSWQTTQTGQSRKKTEFSNLEDFRKPDKQGHATFINLAYFGRFQKPATYTNQVGVFVWKIWILHILEKFRNQPGWRKSCNVSRDFSKCLQIWNAFLFVFELTDWGVC